MKKRLLALALVIVLAMSLCLSAFASNIRTVQTEIYYRKIKIVINDVLISPCDEKGNSTEPFIMNDTTYLPVRAIAGALGLKVGWESSTSTVVLERGGEANYGSGAPSQTRAQKTVTLTYRGTNISLDGENVPLVNRDGDSVEPFIYNGTNYLPLRVVGEALGLSVQWDGRTDSVIMKGSINSEEDDGEGEPDPNVEKQLMPTHTSYLIGYTGYAASFSEYASLDYSYDAYGRLTKLALGDGSRMINCTYDNLGRLTGASVKRGGIINHHKLAYGEDGEIVGVYINGSLSQGYVVTKDAEGRIIREEIVPENDPYRIFEYSYDEYGRIATRTRISLYEKTYRGEYFYDEMGNVEKIVEYAEDNGGQEALAATVYYSYDAEGKAVAEKRVQADGVTVEYEKMFSYDAEGRVTEELYYDHIHNRYDSIVLYKYEYAYDDAGMLVKDYETIVSIWTNENGVREEGVISTCLYDYGYDSEGRKVWEHLEDGQPDQGWWDIHENTWVYSEKGQLIEERFASSRHDGTYGESINFYSYNDKGELVGYREEHWRNGEKLIEKGEDYSYYENGLLARLHVRNTGEEDVTTSYEYNEKAQLVKAVESVNGKVRATETVDYDEEGNVVRTEIATADDYTSVVMEVSYELIPKYAQSPYLDDLIEEFLMDIG
ncbi:MAG: copper amine oxidase N-terminal domain-containing protein [Oscillospiraceae bacterium]|nr:copper amine oxidase N-terminal domain-containing protein [Oscillospiraceae bacterium]